MTYPRNSTILSAANVKLIQSTIWKTIKSVPSGIITMNDEQYKKLEYEYRILSENALECIWVYDIKKQIFTYVSPNVFKLRGLPKEEAVQESLEDAVPEETYREAMENTRRMVALYKQGERRPEILSAVRDMQIYYKDGSIKQIEVTVKLIQNEETGALEVLGITRDITERKQLENQLTQALESKNEIIKRLEDSEKALKRLTSELHQKNKALREIATKDSLTGIYNRYAFDRKVTEEAQRSQRYLYPLSIVLFDIDKFKLINDTWGHDMGDQVLRRIAAAAEKAIRVHDILARWGGEEFVILMPHTHMEAAAKAAEKLRGTLEALHHPGITATVTASFGITEYMHGETKESWFQRVDHALFRSKSEGGNCISHISWTDSIPAARTYMEWNEAWESGNATLDSQHRQIVALGNKAIEALLDTGEKNLPQVTDELLKHIQRHFEWEEAFLYEIHFPQADQHAAAHSALWNRIANAYQRYQDGKLQTPIFFTFLLDEAIIGHIQKEDIVQHPYISEHSLETQ